MGVSVLVLHVFGNLSVETAITLLAIGVTCLAIAQLQAKAKNNP